MAAKVDAVTLTPRTVTVGRTVTVRVKAHANTWESLLAHKSSWQAVLTDFSTWQQVKDY